MTKNLQDRTGRQIETVEGIFGSSRRAILSELPSDPRQLEGIAELDLSNSNVSDLSVLEGLTIFYLDAQNTMVEDLSPLHSSQMVYLNITGSRVRDLRPILDIQSVISSHSFDADARVDFESIPACGDAEIAAASVIEEPHERKVALLKHLRTLPPWPEPLPATHSSEALSVPQDYESPAITTAQNQIAFILRYAATSQISAKSAAEQIKLALRDVPIVPGTNQIPEVFRTVEDLATVLDRLGDAISADDASQKLLHRIAELEHSVEHLTRQLEDAAKTREADDAIANANGFWTSYKPQLARAAANATIMTPIAIAAVGIPTLIHYFLGAEHPLVVSLFKVLRTPT